MIRCGRLIADLFAGAMLAFMLGPLAVLVVFAFVEGPLLSLPVKGFTWRWVAQVFGDERFRTAFANSLTITTAVGAISVVSGFLAALALCRAPPRHGSIVVGLLMSAFMTPPLMLGVALLTFYATWHIPLGLATVVVAHVVFTQPLVVAILLARLARFDFTLLECAMDLGASRLQAYRAILLPQVAPSVVGAAFVAMALSLDDFIVGFFTIGGGSTLPILLWGLLRRGADPSMNVVAVTIMGLSVIGTIVGLRLTRHRG